MLSTERDKPNTPWPSPAPHTLSPASPWIAVLVAVFAAGCGNRVPLGRVEGTVRLDGRPLEDVAVTFLPDAAEGTAGPHSAGKTDAGGRYQLRCEDGREGAAVGSHRVIVEDLAPYRLPRDDDAPPTARAIKPRVPAAYADPSKTPIRREVKPGEQAIDLELSWTKPVNRS
jgi:hypothetical protein